MGECLTKPLTEDFSGCLVEAPRCAFAVRFGFSYLCEHPRHADFHPAQRGMGGELDHNARYRELKEARRSAYLAKVKMFIEDLERGVLEQGAA